MGTNRIVVPARNVTLWPMFLVSVMTIVAGFVGYGIATTDKPAPQQGVAETVVAVIGPYFDTATPTETRTITPTATATLVPTTVPVPPTATRPAYCYEVSYLTPCTPYGTQIPKTPTPTPTVTPIPWCRWQDYKTDTDYICRKPMPVYHPDGKK